MFDANRAPIFQNWASTSALLPRSPIECVQNDFYAYDICSVETRHLSCTDTNTISHWTKTRFHMTHVTYEFHRMCLKLFMSLWFVQCKPCTYASWLALSPNGSSRAPPDPNHLGVPSSASKMIYDPMVRLTQTEHLSCTDANIISKQIETRFHKTLIT
jgi:hypothetical protein